MKNIVLVGMPGSGKSTVGVILAKTLGVQFLDTDLVLQKQEGMLLQQIIEKVGIEEFLEKEAQAAQSVDCTDTVIATGGSVPCRHSGIEALRQNGVVVYLDVSCPEIVRRLTNIKTRGIALGKGQTIQDIFDLREPLYKKYAHVQVACDGLTVEETVEKIIDALKEYGAIA
jgi:shikimate kinase